MQLCPIPVLNLTPIFIPVLIILIPIFIPIPILFPIPILIIFTPIPVR